MRKKSLGQGMTEYIVIVALIAIAAIAVYTLFGGTVKDQVSGMTQELAGQDGSDQVKSAGEKAKTSATAAEANEGLSDYAGQAGAAGGGGGGDSN